MPDGHVLGHIRLAKHLALVRAAAASGTDLTEFVITHASEAARRLLADRERFYLNASTLKEWEAVNARTARDLPGLRRLMQRPSPFAE
jgi:uncharacterized protein (DUF1778 family)